MVTMLRERTASFRHGMLDSAASADDFGSEHAALILNGRIGFDGSAECRGGSTILSTATFPFGGSVLTSDFFSAFTTAAGVQQLVVIVRFAANSSMYYSTDSGSTWTAGATGLTNGVWDHTTFSVSGVNYLILANGSTTMYSWTGSAWAAVTGPATGMRFVATFNERVYASAGDQKVYGSKIRDHTVWASPDGIALTINTHDGDSPIKNIAAADSVLLVQKRLSTSYVDGFGNSDIIVAAGQRGLSQSAGCISFRSFQPVGDQGYMWMSLHGLEYWPGLGSPIYSVGRGVRTLLAGLNHEAVRTDAGALWSLWLPLRNEYWVRMLQTDSTPAVIALHLDHRIATVGGLDFAATKFDGGGDARSVCIADIDTVGMPDQVQRPCGVTPTGQPFLLDYGLLDGVVPFVIIGDAINFRVRSRSFDFGEPTRRKRARIIRVAGIETTDQTATAHLITDGTAKTLHNLTFAAAVDGLPAIDPPVRVSGRGLNHQIEVRGSAGLKVSSFELEAELMESW